MGKIPKYIEEKRDESSIDLSHPLDEFYDKGFDECYALMREDREALLEVIELQREALIEFEPEFSWVEKLNELLKKKLDKMNAK